MEQAKQAISDEVIEALEGEIFYNTKKDVGKKRGASWLVSERT